MVKFDKKLEQMRVNPQDWRIADLQSIADNLGIEWTHNGGSHVIFRNPNGHHISIPAHRPIKPRYVKIFLEFIDSMEEKADDSEA